MIFLKNSGTLEVLQCEIVKEEEEIPKEIQRKLMELKKDDKIRLKKKSFEYFLKFFFFFFKGFLFLEKNWTN